MIGSSKIPRPMQLRADDSLEESLRQIDEHGRDVRAFLSEASQVIFVQADASAPGVALPNRSPKAVSVARVLSGAVTAAPFVDWEPSLGGIAIRSVYGVAPDATLMLRIEV